MRNSVPEPPATVRSSTGRPVCDAVPRPAADRGFAAADHRRRRHQDRHHAGRADGRRGRLLLPGRGQNLALAMPFVLVGGLGGLGPGADRHVRPQAGQPGDRAELRRARGPVPRRDLVRRRQLLCLRRQRRRADRPGDPRHPRRVLRHARRLQDRRHPRDAEVHPDARRGHVRRARRWCSATSCSAMFGVGGGEGLGLRSGGPIAIIFSLVCIGSRRSAS